MPKLLAGKYSLTRRLGAGGTAAVYLAWDLSLQRDVAVKTLTDLAEVRPALTSEAWTMARVAHPSLAEIHGVESWQGRPFLLVEFLRGGTLADRLRRGAVPGPEAVAVALSLAEALAALHEAGYLHGDVKPSNVGFTANGFPKLLDFGLARGPHDARIAGGTLRYLSPEVLDGQPAAEADDVWSLCVVLYEMVVGEHPFAGDDVDEVADRIREQRSGAGGRPTAGSATSGARGGVRRVGAGGSPGRRDRRPRARSPTGSHHTRTAPPPTRSRPASSSSRVVNGHDGSSRAGMR